MCSQFYFVNFQFFIKGEPETNGHLTDDGSNSSAPSSDENENEEEGELDPETGENRKRKKKSKKGRISNTDLFSSHKFLFGVIFSRCNDSSALVRAKALSTLAEVTGR